MMHNEMIQKERKDSCYVVNIVLLSQHIGQSCENSSQKFALVYFPENSVCQL